MGISYNDYEPTERKKRVVIENVVFIGCIQFYRSKEHVLGNYGKKDTSYNGGFGFDKFDKKVCAEGLIGEYEQLTTVMPDKDPLRDVKKYLCSYLSIWPPNVEGNVSGSKSKVKLYVKAEKATTKIENSGDIEFKSTDPNVIINGNATVNLIIDGEAKELNIECIGTFENDVYIEAKAKGENQLLGRLIIKANAIRYKTVIQPVELVFGITENLSNQEISHTTFIEGLVKDFNNKSFNQAHIYGELAPKTKKITLNKNEFERDGFLSTKEDGKVYLKKDSEEDSTTVEYNKKVEERYAASLTNQTQKQALREKVQNTIIEVLSQFEKKFSFNKEGNLKYIAKLHAKQIATTAWKYPNVQKAYEDYKIAKSKYDSFGGELTGLNKENKLHFFYTTDIHGARNPEAKVLAYSGVTSGVAHIFESALNAVDGKSVVLHELGHGLGLHHPFDKKKLGDYAIKEENKRYEDDIEKDIEFLKGNKKENEGEIKRLENQKREIEKSNKNNVNENEFLSLRILQAKYNGLQRYINYKLSLEIEDFETFIRNLNEGSKSAISIESNALDMISNAKSITIEEINIQLNDANQKLESLKLELKNSEETKVYSRAINQSATLENYMDYHQDSNGNVDADFERKSYYQWQWKEIQLTGNSEKYFEKIK